MKIKSAEIGDTKTFSATVVEGDHKGLTVTSGRYPAVVTLAKALIDRGVDPDRLVTFEDHLGYQAADTRLGVWAWSW